MLAGCGGKPKPGGAVVVPGAGPGTEPEAAKAVEPPGPPLPASPKDLARADLVALGTGTVTGWAIDGGKLVELSSVELAKVDPEDYQGAIDGAWADHDHFIVHVPPRDVVVVTADRMTRIAVPPETAFKAPRPTTPNDDGLIEGGVIEDEGYGLVVASGAAWWVECPWGFPYDGWQCEAWTRAKLWLVDKPVVEAGSVTADAWAWPTIEVSGFRTKELDDGQALGCMPPPGTRQKQSQLRGSVEDGEMISSHHWVSASPPRLLVVYGTPGMYGPMASSWALHDGCLPKPLAVGTRVEPGPDGLWVAWESDNLKAKPLVTRQVLRRGAEVIGEMPHSDVRFRPPAE